MFWPLCNPHKNFASIPVPAWSHSPISFLLDFTQPTPLILQVTLCPAEALPATSRPTTPTTANILAPLEPSQALCLHSSDRLVTLLPSIPAGLYPVNPCNNSGDRPSTLTTSNHATSRPTATVIRWPLGLPPIHLVSTTTGFLCYSPSNHQLHSWLIAFTPFLT